jgi:hypothetical protein
MGFRKPNLEDAYSAIRTSIVEISSPYNDGWTSSCCKQDLYMLKCWLNDAYDKLPAFAGEEKWEQETLLKILKRSN